MLFQKHILCFVCGGQSDVQVPELMAFVLFISQQVFPVLHKFRYCNPRSREKIGKCAENLCDMGIVKVVF
jgi:hypothetical protein